MRILPGPNSPDFYPKPIMHTDCDHMALLPPHTDKLLPGKGILVSRGIVYLVFALSGAALAWSAATKIDLVVSAGGQVTIRGEPIQITPSRSGMIRDVNVQVGDQVAAGDVLLQLETFELRREQQQVTAEIAALRLQEERYQQAAERCREMYASLEPRRLALDARQAILVTRKDRLAALAERQTVAQAVVEQAEIRLQQHQAELSQLDTYALEYHRDGESQARLAAEANARLVALRAKLAQLEERCQRSTLRAPVDGIVTQLAVRHPGSAIGIDGPAATIVPSGEPLIACIHIPNESMRRMHRGLRARLEVQAFPRADYGYVDGRVIQIEPEADKQGKYKAWIKLNAAGSEWLPRLKPGLSLKANIVVERQTVLDQLLKPFRRLDQPIRVAG